jgi:cell pole-organizing protein PopZ
MIMGDLSSEPSMEEILASIRRIIAEEGEAAVPTPRARPQRAARGQATETGTAADAPSVSDAPDQDDDILELTEPMAMDDSLLSDEAANASRRSLAALAMSVTEPGPSGESPIEAMVRDLLRPMLKEWLDANLPAIVDAKVAAEIARITRSR